MNQYGAMVTAPGTMQVHGICKAYPAEEAGIRQAAKMGGESLCFVSKGLWRRHESQILSLPC